MINFKALITISRPANVAMSSIAVVLGFWIAKPELPLPLLLLLVVASGASVAFGNTINDILDIDTDRISHSERPLPSETISIHQTVVYACVCAVTALGTALFVSSLHTAGVIIPLAALVVYALFLKGTPLVGNILVSLLVAYPLLFGALSGSDINRLYIPAILAFLLNSVREILKDIQDIDGDTATGLRTTAVLSHNTLKLIIASLSLLYILLVPLPFLLHQFGWVYATICLVIILPVHIFWTTLIIKKQFNTQVGRCASLIKIEMLAGLIAIAADNVFVHL
jgi:geranylgeranylglycerol-phosphate geranylgeranyltransferase